MYNKDLEYQYSPTRWSTKKVKADQVIDDHVRIVTEASEMAKRTVPHKLDVNCNSLTAKHRVDIFGTDLPKASPILIYIHGGYWQAFDRQFSSYVVRPLYAAGIKTVVAGYSLAPTVSIDHIIQEIQQTCSWVLDMALEDNSAGVWIAGHSAGAHLSSTLLNPSWIDTLEQNKRALLKGLILIGGVFDLTPLVQTYINDALALTRESAENVGTCTFFKRKHDLNVLITVGGHDTDELRRQSREAFNDSVDAGNQVEFLFLEECDHFDIVEKLQEPSFVLTKKIILLIKNYNK